jgi:hypothetical protein
MTRHGGGDSAGTKGILFVVDSSDRQRMHEARTELHNLLQVMSLQCPCPRRPNQFSAAGDPLGVFKSSPVRHLPHQPGQRLPLFDSILIFLMFGSPCDAIPLEP